MRGHNGPAVGRRAYSLPRAAPRSRRPTQSALALRYLKAWEPHSVACTAPGQTSAEDGAGWLALFRDLVARGLSGVSLVTSDAHRGLVEAIGATLPGACLAAVPHQ